MVVPTKFLVSSFLALQTFELLRCDRTSSLAMQPRKILTSQEWDFVW